MAKIITTITAIYDTETKEVEVYKDVVERIDPEHINGVAPTLMSLTPGKTYTDSVCAKCDTKIAVRIDDFRTGSNYCHACAMAKLGA